MGTNDEYVRSMEMQLKKWDADVEALAAEGEKAGAEARATYYARIQELRLASQEAGAQMQAGVKVAWETMQKALEKVSADLRK
jgi:hypothetical protein